MKQTTNYKFKKPELTDSPPDITVLDENFDIIDEKLFAIVKAWEDFKVNGGDIGGVGVFSNSYKQLEFRVDGDLAKIIIGDMDLGASLKSANGYTKLPNGFILQWIEVDVNFATAQSQDISVTMPIGFSSAGAFGFVNCITNSATAKYTTTAVTTTNSLAGTVLLRVATTQAIKGTLKFKVLAIGY